MEVGRPGLKCDLPPPRFQACLSHFKNLSLLHQARQVPHHRTQAGGRRRRRPPALETGRLRRRRGRLHHHDHYDLQNHHPAGPGAAPGAAGHRDQRGEGWSTWGGGPDHHVGFNRSTGQFDKYGGRRGLVQFETITTPKCPCRDNTTPRCPRRDNTTPRCPLRDDSGSQVST